jgi:DNA-binding LytR/AlgR family response regulator
MKIFLVEDEWIHAEDVRISVENLGHEWLGYSAEGFDAMEKITALQPDVILLDMMLHGAQSGIAIATHINKNVKKPFIFITSIIDDAVIEQGLHTNPVAYLTKPVSDGDLKAALIKAKAFLQSGNNESEINTNATQLLIRVGNNLKAVNKADITFIETAEKNYCKIHTTQQLHFTVKKSLTALHQLLNPAHFYRVHKEYLINLNAVSKIDEAEHLIYVDKQAIPIGSNYKNGLLQHFNIL